MRISNKFDIPAVLHKGIYYFPQDDSKLIKRDEGLKATIQAVYKTYKYFQDTMYICPILYLNLLEYLVNKTYNIKKENLNN